MIVAIRATKQSSDKGQAATMIEETINNAGSVAQEVSADAGYYSAKAVEELCILGVDPFIAPEKTRDCWAPPHRRPGAVYPGISLPSTGCCVSCRPNEADSATL